MKNSLATPCESICARAAGRRGVLIKIIRVRGEVLLISPDNRRPSSPRSYRYRYLDGWQEKQTKASLLFGRCFREGLGSLFLPRRQHRNLVQGVGCPARSNTGIFEERLLGPDGPPGSSSARVVRSRQPSADRGSARNFRSRSSARYLIAMTSSRTSMHCVNKDLAFDSIDRLTANFANRF